jgi:hypothetical protein
MISGKKNLGNLISFIIFGPGILRIFKITGFFILFDFLIYKFTKNAGDKPDNRIDQNH